MSCIIMADTGFENFLFNGKMVSGGHMIIQWLADFTESDGSIGEYGWLLASAKAYRSVRDVGLRVIRKKPLVEDR